MGENRRGVGPFSGGQITMMVCVIVAAIAFPAGAWAVSGSNVFVADATSGVRAAVSSSGAVSVSGSVNANNATPKNLFQQVGYPAVDVPSPVAVPPAGKALIVTSVSVDTYLVGPGGHVDMQVSSRDATCATAVSRVAWVDVTAIGVQSIPIPSGLVIPANRALCANGVAGVGTVTMVFGYLVAASSAPRGATTPGKPAAPLLVPPDKP